MLRKRKQYPYFESLVQAMDYSCQSSELLHISLSSFEPEEVESMMVSLHRIEHTADEAKHTLMNHLAQERRPPIAREDIIQLAQAVDTVTDCIEDVLMRIYMFHIQVIRPEALQFSDLICRCCVQLKEIFKELPPLPRSGAIRRHIIEVNRLEAEADRLYCDSVRALYAPRLDPIETVSWTETFSQMEKCCDACEHTANLVELILLKNA